MNKDVGRNAERELVSILRNAGYNSVRIPTSNSSGNPLPDVFAVRGSVLLSIEVKSTWERKVKVRSIQLDKILRFVSMFPLEGHALIAVKFKSLRQWRYFEVFSPSDVVVDTENTRPLEELLGQVILQGSEISTVVS
ncbi:endonuclease [Metallosphaera tengchongensis]|uniref:Endonuclease n=1 Tax=Metallosphaera tengchongensis TaxID=1532350 RepID=A0A6N0NTV4_9CREN|nr:Holliday junction resolvase Hjc [Metallosphaera tengchongensis]QKR00122.1 endonuclease [Metallosphaera tengchongensis]